MSMHIETSNQRALQLTNQSWSDINLYKQSKERARLESAQAKLEQAISEDPKYLKAFYYRAMVNDLIGRSEDAIEQFEKVLQEQPPFIDDVRYHLGMAHYHRYSRSHLEQAAEYFRTVITNTNDQSLKMLAHAGLAQTYAMRMIQPDPGHPDYEDAQTYFALSQEQYEIVIRALAELPVESEDALNEIRWEIYNGHGMSLMYHTDYFGSREEKINRLRLALDNLKKADEFSPKNWANYCDLGSVHMRLGHWSGSVEEFEAALSYLNEVVDSLRPKYGFALYEIGRTYRLMGEFERAMEYFNEALSIKYEYRDVSDKRISIENERAASKSQEYP